MKVLGNLWPDIATSPCPTSRRSQARLVAGVADGSTGRWIDDGPKAAPYHRPGQCLAASRRPTPDDPGAARGGVAADGSAVVAATTATRPCRFVVQLPNRKPPEPGLAASRVPKGQARRYAAWGGVLVTV